MYITFSNALYGFFGGGSIISNRHVLTVGQVVSGFTTWRVGFGSHLFAQLSWQDTTESVLHPNYNLDTRDNDVAIIVLQSVLTWTPQVQPIQLPPLNMITPLDNEQGIIMGFGWTSGQQQQSPNLQIAFKRAIPDHICQPLIMVSFPNHFCAYDGIHPANFCQGDLGGGFLVYYRNQLTLVGMNSILLEACETNWPSAYTRISAYRGWINQITGV